MSRVILVKTVTGEFIACADELQAQQIRLQQTVILLERTLRPINDPSTN